MVAGHASLLLAQKLPGDEVIVVSNREPYIHKRDGDGIVGADAGQRPRHGARAVMRACCGTWIAHGSGSADRETVDRFDRVARAAGCAELHAAPRLADARRSRGYYYGFANEGLWPLCHIAYVRPELPRERLGALQRVNARFADAVVSRGQDARPDRAGAGLPLRAAAAHDPREAAARDHHHVLAHPLAEPGDVRHLPVAEEIIDGLLGSSILGFHTQFHCNNFLDTVDRFLESAHRPRAVVRSPSAARRRSCGPIRSRSNGRRPAWRARSPWPSAARAVRERLGLAETCALGVGIERFDYTKGILERMHAVDALLDRASGMDRPLHLRPGRRADPQQACRLPRSCRSAAAALAERDQRALRRRRRTSRSC